MVATTANPTTNVTSQNTPEFELFHPREKGRWQKLGVAFRNRDGSLSLLLEYIPVGAVDGQVRIVAQPYEPREAGERGLPPGEAASDTRGDESPDRTMPSARGKSPRQSHRL